MAKAQTSTPDTDVQERRGADQSRANYKLAIACREWESDLCDIQNMSGILGHLAEDMFCRKTAADDGFETHILFRQRIEQLMFAVYRTDNMIREFVAKYYSTAYPGAA